MSRKHTLNKTFSGSIGPKAYRQVVGTATVIPGKYITVIHRRHSEATMRKAVTIAVVITTTVPAVKAIDAHTYYLRK